MHRLGTRSVNSTRPHPHELVMCNGSSLLRCIIPLTIQPECEAAFIPPSPPCPPLLPELSACRTTSVS